MKNELTEKSYWEDGYQGVDEHSALIDLNDFRELPFRRIFDLIKSVGLDGKQVLEVGAGNSSVLLSLAKNCGMVSNFCGLDYTEAGCTSLRNRAAFNSVNIDVIHADMFSPDNSLKGSFDVLYSIGVVEHFSDLPPVIASLSAFLKPGGTMVTIIPNMRGMIGYLTRKMNIAVYDLHNPHDIASLKDAHLGVGLDVLRADYLCSNNFGVLSSCVNSDSSVAWRLYVFLTRISKLLWRVEKTLGDLPKSQALSPYLFVISVKR